MEIIDSLKFVKNGYAKDEMIPGLSYFVIRNKTVTAFNGEIAMSSPITIDLDIAPQALHFHKCIEACEDTIALTVEKSGKLRVKSGRFKSLVNCIPYEEVPTILPVGRKIEVKNSMLEAIKNMLPFIDPNSDRDFSKGLFMQGQTMTATNNKALVQYWMGFDLPTLTIPKKALIELVRNGEEPEHLLVSDSMLFFMLPNDRWIASKLMAVTWPNLEPILASEANLEAFPADFWDSLERLNRFADEAGKCYFKDSQMSTCPYWREEGATVECQGLPDKGIYNSNELIKLKDIASKVGFDEYPAPIPFTGDKCRGMILGYRV